jgi:hypothetical protein
MGRYIKGIIAGPLANTTAARKSSVTTTKGGSQNFFRAPRNLKHLISAFTIFSNALSPNFGAEPIRPALLAGFGRRHSKFERMHEIGCQ